MKEYVWCFWICHHIAVYISLLYCRVNLSGYMWVCFLSMAHINGLVHDCSNSIATVMELLQFCTKPSIYDIFSQLADTLPEMKKERWSNYKIHNDFGAWSAMDLYFHRILLELPSAEHSQTIILHCSEQYIRLQTPRIRVNPGLHFSHLSGSPLTQSLQCGALQGGRFASGKNTKRRQCLIKGMSWTLSEAVTSHSSYSLSQSYIAL